MALVLIVSLGLFALRSESATWAGGLYLLTYAVLLLAVVGGICQTGSDRVWWIGFALFGITYFRWTLSFPFQNITLPTTLLLDLMRPAGVGAYRGFEGDPFAYFWLVGHCLWSLLIATIGGGLARALFAGPRNRPARLDGDPRPVARPACGKWRGAVAIGLALFVPFSALILLSPLSHPALLASALYLTTWLLLGITVLGAACGSGKRRMVWFGAALFGLGYMILNRSGDGFEQSTYFHLVTDEFLEAVRPKLPDILSGFPAKTAAMASENLRIKKILDRKIPMKFREETSLETVLDYLRATTKALDGRELPIYVNPQALQDVDKTMQSLIQIDLEDCSLETTLRLALRQLNLSPYIINGMVYVTGNSTGDTPDEIDYYLLVGHCIMAMLSAGLGACLVPLVSNR